MTVDEIHALVERHALRFQAGDPAGLAADHAEDGVVESPSTGTHRGRQEIEESYARWLAAFPGLEFSTETIVAESDQAAVFYKVSATHQGEFLGLPPTGKRIEFRGVLLQQFKGDRIAHERRIYDFSGMLIKLGVLKVKPGT